MSTQYIPRVTTTIPRTLKVDGTVVHAGDLMEFLKTVPADATLSIYIQQGVHRDSLMIEASDD